MPIDNTRIDRIVTEIYTLGWNEHYAHHAERVVRALQGEALVTFLDKLRGLHSVDKYAITTMLMDYLHTTERIDQKEIWEQHLANLLTEIQKSKEEIQEKLKALKDCIKLELDAIATAKQLPDTAKEKIITFLIGELLNELVNKIKE